MPRSNDINDNIKSALAELAGTRVRVAIVPDGFTRNTFGPQVSVAGVLEARTTPSNTTNYRVMHNEDNFSYFSLDNVVVVSVLASVPTIMLQIPVITPEDN